MEAGAELEQGRQPAADADRPRGGAQDPRDHLQQRGLAAAVVADQTRATRPRGPRSHVAERPEVLGARAGADQARPSALEGFSRNSRKRLETWSISIAAPMGSQLLREVAGEAEEEPPRVAQQQQRCRPERGPASPPATRARRPGARTDERDGPSPAGAGTYETVPYRARWNPKTIVASGLSRNRFHRVSDRAVRNVLHQRALVHDRREPEPDQQPEVHQVLHVAVPHVRPATQNVMASREHEQRRRTASGIHPQAVQMEAVADHEHEHEQHGRLQHEVDERHADRRRAAGSRAGSRPSSRGSRCRSTDRAPWQQRVAEAGSTRAARTAGTRGSPASCCCVTITTNEKTARKTTGFSSDHTAPSTEAVYLTFSSLRTRFSRISR